MKLIIEDDEGRKTVVPLVRDELSIGRHEENVVRLTEKNVSRRHARIVRQDGRYFIEDLSSFTGIRVNGERVKGKCPVGEGDLIEISEYDLVLQDAPGAQRPVAPADEDDEPTDISRSAEGRSGKSSAEADTERVQMSELAGVAAAAARDLEPAERPRLVGLTEPVRGREFLLFRTPTGIGRTPENDVEIEHASVSRHHCQLFLEGTTWKLLDNRSAHGVKVNGAPFAVSRLRPGDTLEVGQIKLRFVGPGESFSLPVSPSASAPPTQLPATSPRRERDEPLDPTIPDLGPPAGMRDASAAGMRDAPPAGMRDASAAGMQSGSAARRAAPAATGSGAAMQAPESGAESSLPATLPPAPRAIQQGARRRLFALGAAALFAIALAVVVVLRSRAPAPAATVPAPDDDGVQVTAIRPEVIDAELKAAQAASAARKYDEALRHYDAAAKAGASAQELRGQAAVIAAQRAQLGGEGSAAGTPQQAQAGAAGTAQQAQAGTPQQAQAGTAGTAQVDQQVAQARGDLAAEPPKEPAAVARRDLAAEQRKELATQPRQDLAAEPRQEPAAVARRDLAAEPRSPAEAGRSAPSQPPADPDQEARKLIADGNRQVVARNFEGAIPIFQQALELKPSPPVLASIYRSMGIAFTQQGNVEEGARYYRLYLPLCTNAKEKQILQQTLDEYDARRR